MSALINSEPLGASGKEVLRITSDGRMIIGEGLSAEDATQQAAKLLIEQFNRLIEEMVQQRIKNMETNK